MRSLCNHLADPSLHLLGIALILIFMALGRAPWSSAIRAEDPLPTCQVCHGHYLPGGDCECRQSSRLAHILR